MRSPTPEDIDSVLPQTQCGLCGFGGCMPYAEAMIFESAAINLCPPGGIKTLNALGKLLQQDPIPFVADMEQKAKPKMMALIREAECIGCTKCIQACPVDAILGGAKQMHTVLTDECTGCELCVAPCPVDCIEMLVINDDVSSTREEEKKDVARRRFNARNKRLQNEKTSDKLIGQSIQKRKSYIEEAILRAKKKKTQP